MYDCFYIRYFGLFFHVVIYMYIEIYMQKNKK